MTQGRVIIITVSAIFSGWHKRFTVQAFMRGIHGLSGNCRGPVMLKTFTCYGVIREVAWWRHQMETFSALLAICSGNSPVNDEFPTQRPVTRSFGIFFNLRLNKQLSKQWRGWWFETSSCPSWRHCNKFRLVHSGGWCINATVNWVLFGAKPLPELMLKYCQLDPLEQTSFKL